MSEKDEKSIKTAPYMSFKTLETFLELMKSTTLPPIIDNSLLPKMSGSQRSTLMSTLKYMGLISMTGGVQEPLRKLVAAYGTPDWKEAFGELLSQVYAPIIGDIPLDSGTASMLDKAFRERGGANDGQMIGKCVRFYLSALDSAGDTYSPHFKAKRAPAGPRKPRLPKNNKNKGDQGGAGAGQEIGSGYTPNPSIDPDLDQFVIPIPGKKSGLISLPKDLEEADWFMVKAILDAYVTRLTDANANKPAGAKPESVSGGFEDVDIEEEFGEDDGEDYEDYDPT